MSGVDGEATSRLGSRFAARLPATDTVPMPHADFVHLRVHSAYSLSEGAIKAEKIAALAHAASMPAVAITDTANLFGALEFSQACTARGVQPIIGCQIAFARTDGSRAAPDPIVLLAQDAAGLTNLRRLSSAGFLETEPGLPPHVPIELLCAHADGLLLLTGGTRGPFGRLLAEARQPEAAALLARLAEAFPGRVAVELHRHGLADRTGDRAGDDRARRRSRPAAGRDQRMLLRRSRDARGARRTAVHRRRAPDRGPGPAARHPGALVQAGCRDARTVRRPAGSVRQHARDRAALRGDGRDAEADAAGLIQGRTRQHRGGDGARDGDRRAGAADGGARRRRGRRERSIASGSTTSST